MSRPTRRQILHGSAAALAGAALAAPVAFADTAAARPADGHGQMAGDGPSGGHEMPEPFDEMYEGRHIEGWPADEGDAQNGGHNSSGAHAGRHAGPHDGMDFVVRIDNDDLHVMRNADGTWISLVNHYETFTTPRALARAAVRELQGADLVPVVTG
ncbi:Tyrosinase co-factor MelC1 [Streptomyces sp. 2323.1]|uniref:apotyrosinase chaperone MelC1 n=1 Tax=Streptomyces sp. 2323.1 TaxID=1938841 RepID=UPI000BB852EB|nr:tyrosinase family oxidase copper chaperone [Streptomyces sp. 2323.1]SOE09119.1 Tyrosinase co-factor MelC1 [Streptomyces sp. 2323.1]